MSELIGKNLGKYQIDALLGRGAMGEVYRGHQAMLRREVAIKTIYRHLAHDPNFVRRFEREANLAASLRHPNIVQVFDYDVQDGVPYMVMELISGRSLKERLAELKAGGQYMGMPEVLRILRGVASALDYAHGKEAVHRDVKPGNILVTGSGDPVLVDFGIARIQESAELTATGMVLGTPAYLSPEQARGDKADARSDIYSLGIVLYEMLAGRVPFEADSTTGVLMKLLTEPPPGLRRLRPELSLAVEQVCLKVLTKEPDDRYQTACAMVDALQAALQAPAPPELEATVVEPRRPQQPAAALIVEPPPANEPAGSHPQAGFAPEQPAAAPIVEPSVANDPAGSHPQARPAPKQPAAAPAARSEHPAPAPGRRPRPWKWLAAAALLLVVVSVAGMLVASSGRGAILAKPTPTEQRLEMQGALPAPTPTEQRLEIQGALPAPTPTEQHLEIQGALPAPTPADERLLPSGASFGLAVDNADPGFSITAGEWGWCSSGECGGLPYKSDFRYAEPGCTDCEARFAMDVPRNGVYDIWAWWPHADDRATDTPFIIQYGNDEETTVKVDQRSDGSRWFRLERLPFDAGKLYYIIVRGSATGFANADAVALTLPEPGTAP